MSTANVNALAPAPIIMWWDGGERAITAREKARIEEHGPSCFSIALVPATPSARWAADGLPDPHAGRYACERAALTLGNLTDDELANAVYLHGNEQPSMADLVAGKALSGIVYLTAAKERIRWLSRALEATCKQPLQVGEVQGDALSTAARAVIAAHDGPDFITDALVDALRAALAARQPGAQVPYGFVLDWKHAPASFTTKAGVAAEHRDYKNCTVVPVYRAPPAQGIDLGKFTDADVRAWVERNDLGGSFGSFTDARCAFDDARSAHLIDSQRDAAPGVANA